MENNFVSPTYGKVDMHKMIDIMYLFYEKHKELGEHFNVVIGTDSQNFSDTKMVSAIVMQCEGHGGIYFYKVERIPKIQDVRQKLNYETQTSLQYADELLKLIVEKYEDLFEAITFSMQVTTQREKQKS